MRASRTCSRTTSAGRSAGATADFEQGAVGAGAGMSCFDWKGGIGSSSRRAGEHTVGVLLLTNFGSREQLRVDGVPVGRLLDERPDDAPEPAAAASRSSRPTRRSRRRSSSGSRAGRASGSRAPARSPTTAAARSSSRSRTSDERSFSDRELDPLFQAVVDATEEAVLCSLWAAVDTAGREGRLVRALPREKVLELYRGRGRGR